MTRRLGSILAIAALSLTLPATAGEIDGKWECRSFGNLIATIGIADADYVVANTTGPSGRGTLSGGAAGFSVDNGALLDALEIEGGRLTLDRGEPMLSLASSRNGTLYCYLQ